MDSNAREEDSHAKLGEGLAPIGVLNPGIDLREEPLYLLKDGFAANPVLTLF
jgi:hypothetical protein